MMTIQPVSTVYSVVRRLRQTMKQSTSSVNNTPQAPAFGLSRRKFSRGAGVFMATVLLAPFAVACATPSNIISENLKKKPTTEEKYEYLMSILSNPREINELKMAALAASPGVLTEDYQKATMVLEVVESGPYHWSSDYLNWSKKMAAEVKDSALSDDLKQLIELKAIIRNNKDTANANDVNRYYEFRREVKAKVESITPKTK